MASVRQPPLTPWAHAPKLQTAVPAKVCAEAVKYAMHQRFAVDANIQKQLRLGLPNTQPPGAAGQYVLSTFCTSRPYGVTHFGIRDPAEMLTQTFVFLDSANPNVWRTHERTTQNAFNGTRPFFFFLDKKMDAAERMAYKP